MQGRFMFALVCGAMSAALIAGCSPGRDASADSAKAAAAVATDSAATAATAAPAGPAALSDQIRDAENAWRIALVSGDTVELSKLTATGFTMVEPGRGTTRSRSQLMNDVGGGTVQSDTSAINDLAVSGSGDSAIAKLTFYWRPSRMGKPAKVETGPVEDVWVRADSTWKLAVRRAGDSK
jgi:hypothetical protein